jgi:hypothetical protein
MSTTTPEAIFPRHRQRVDVPTNARTRQQAVLQAAAAPAAPEPAPVTIAPPVATVTVATAAVQKQPTSSSVQSPEASGVATATSSVNLEDYFMGIMRVNGVSGAARDEYPQDPAHLPMPPPTGAFADTSLAGSWDGFPSGCIPLSFSSSGLPTTLDASRRFCVSCVIPAPFTLPRIGGSSDVFDAFYHRAVVVTLRDAFGALCAFEFFAEDLDGPRSMRVRLKPIISRVPIAIPREIEPPLVAEFRYRSMLGEMVPYHIPPVRVRCSRIADDQFRMPPGAIAPCGGESVPVIFDASGLGSDTKGPTSDPLRSMSDPLGSISDPKGSERVATSFTEDTFRVADPAPGATETYVFIPKNVMHFTLGFR